MYKQPNIFVRSLFGIVLLGAFSLLNSVLLAQSGMRESLERLDKNENNLIEPEEITPLARPFLERITKERRMRLDKPLTIDSLQEAARIYHALKNGVSGEDVRPEGESTVQPFGPNDDEPIVPEFGLAKVKYPYIQDDLDQADRTLRRNDRNEDGFVDRREASRGEWTHRNPFDDDLDKDFRLSRLELAQRYARRRLLADDSKELIQKYMRTGSELRKYSQDNEKDDSKEWWREGGDSHWLTAAIMGRFDKNRNGKLEFREAQATGIPVTSVDIDRDGELTRDELFAYVGRLQKEAGDLTEGLPGWFYELDEDRDGQVEMSEFATEWTDAKYKEFESIDLNRDGLLTENEVMQSKAITGGSYNNVDAELLPPRKTIISEIEVTDDYLIRDLNVQVSITHSNVSYLDAYLTGPDGQRVELFSEIGGSGNHFEQTIFDDQSSFPVHKAKPPYEGSFQPQALEKRQPGLSSFNDKSVKGVWQLVIRGTRNERFGMLNSWGLTIVPQEDSIIGASAVRIEQPENVNGAESDESQTDEPESPETAAPSEGPLADGLKGFLESIK